MYFIIISLTKWIQPEMGVEGKSEGRIACCNRDGICVGGREHDVKSGWFDWAELQTKCRLWSFLSYHFLYRTVISLTKNYTVKTYVGGGVL